MINNVTIVGRLTRDPELRYTPSNIAITTFNMAVNRNFKSQAGQMMICHSRRYSFEHDETIHD